MNKKVLVVDLDGTLYATNTFHQFILYLLKSSVRNLDLVLCFQIVFFSFLRGIKILSHSRFKFFILKKTAKNSNGNYLKFVESIDKYKRDITSLYSQKFDLKILATAAPACYSNLIAKKINFDACIATETPISDFSLKFENAKVNKKKNVVDFLKKKGVSPIDLFITDHIDDLPLIKISKRNIIINPDFEFEKALQSLNIQYEVVKYS